MLNHLQTENKYIQQERDSGLCFEARIACVQFAAVDIIPLSVSHRSGKTKSVRILNRPIYRSIIMSPMCRANVSEATREPDILVT